METKNTKKKVAPKKSAPKSNKKVVNKPVNKKTNKPTNKQNNTYKSTKKTLNKKPQKNKQVKSNINELDFTKKRNIELPDDFIKDESVQKVVETKKVETINEKALNIFNDYNEINTTKLKEDFIGDIIDDEKEDFDESKEYVKKIILDIKEETIEDIINEEENLDKTNEIIQEITKEDYYEETECIKEEKENNNINMRTNKKVKTINVKKIIQTISLSLFMITAIFATIFSLNVVKLNMIPNKYIYIMVGVLLFIMFGIFLLANGKKKKTNLLGSLFSIILTTLFIFASSFVNKTHNTLSNFFNNEESSIIYKVVVLKTSEYGNLSMLSEKNVGILRENSVNVKEYLEKSNINVLIYDTLGELTLSLDNDTQAIVVNQDMLTTISELDKDFYEKIKEIAVFNLNIGADIPKEELPVDDPVEEKTEEQIRLEEKMARRKEELLNLKKGNSFIVYISGVDASSGDSAASCGLSDVNMLAVVNPDVNKVLLISIPRDYYVYVNGRKDKLTHAGLYGVNTSIKTLENLFDIKIDYYLKVSFSAVTTLVDDIGGIEVYSDTSFNSSHIRGWYVEKGMVSLDGRKALAYSRERYAYASGDRHRGQNQQDVIDAIIKKISTNTSILLSFNDLLNHVNPYVATSIPYEKMQSLVKKQIDTLQGWSVSKYSVDGYNSWNYSASFPAQAAYVMEPNYQTIFNAQDKIISIVKGG